MEEEEARLMDELTHRLVEGGVEVRCLGGQGAGVEGPE